LQISFWKVNKNNLSINHRLHWDNCAKVQHILPNASRHYWNQIEEDLLPRCFRRLLSKQRPMKCFAVQSTLPSAKISLSLKLMLAKQEVIRIGLRVAKKSTQMRYGMRNSLQLDSWLLRYVRNLQLFYGNSQRWMPSRNSSSFQRMTKPNFRREKLLLTENQLTWSLSLLASMPWKTAG